MLHAGHSKCPTPVRVTNTCYFWIRHSGYPILKYFFFGILAYWVYLPILLYLYPGRTLHVRICTCTAFAGGVMLTLS
ncbi:uncharacterized protein BDR25DRAFT_69385 [Lindgomyces ingoldianus]|uniref:Uncharacterized protein n=1 Tax=Lindgomyces ingoldianus TaxID=673940 RepID=A0ACB6QJY5_9PLEO|nr:uncharacterized protein BDR25DRAFT_69385 [Lindgomyces ingoldianus]KAF2467177.1 hypothetical protein BDR25DRAFT_69385 [Lindgomyces ingoldianus]